MSFRQSLTLRHLRLVASLGRELSISRTAEALHTSQSAVSRGLAEIEELLGVRLFERTTRLMIATSFGRTLIGHAEQILSQLERAEADFDALSRGNSQHLDIGIMGAFSPPLLREAIRLSRETTPDAHIRFHSNIAEGLVPDLVGGRFNLIVTHLETRHFGVADLVVEPLYQDGVSLLVSPDHPLAGRTDLRWSDMTRERWVLLPTETSTRRAVERKLMMHTGGDADPIVIETMELHFAVELVRSGGLITALPTSVASWFADDLGLLSRLQPIDEDAHWTVCVAHLRSRELSPIERAFAACLKTACAAWSGTSARSEVAAAPLAP